jgi:hypothetical protein
MHENVKVARIELAQDPLEKMFMLTKLTKAKHYKLIKKSRQQTTKCKENYNGVIFHFDQLDTLSFSLFVIDNKTL